MPQKLDGTVDLGSDPASFVRDLYNSLPQLDPGNYAQTIRNFGETLWGKAPDFFHRAYWAMRKVVGDSFPVQFITTDPNVPWELMRPIPDGDAKTDILPMTHPVARCVGDAYGSLRPHLPQGKIATIAPKYKSANDRLERAEEETRMLQDRYGAEPVEGTRKGVWTLLTEPNPGQVSIVHFAGHGDFQIDAATKSSLKLEDGDLTAGEVNTREVQPISDTCLSDQYKAITSTMGKISVLASDQDEVLKLAFPVGNPLAGIVSRGDPYWHGALGRACSSQLLQRTWPSSWPN